MVAPLPKRQKECTGSRNQLQFSTDITGILHPLLIISEFAPILSMRPPPVMAKMVTNNSSLVVSHVTIQWKREWLFMGGFS